MSLTLAVLSLIGGLVVLVWSADVFVVGAEAFALRRGWSPAVIGAVVVGFGTSLPEMVTSGVASWRGQAELAIGNAAGSNLANLLLVLGVAAAVAPLAGSGQQAPRRDALLAGIAGVVLLGASLDGRLGLLEGIVLIVVLVAVLGWQVAAGRGGPQVMPERITVRAVELRILIGLVGVLGGAQLLVVGATDIAARVGVPELVVGTVLVAVGTSLPELATAIASARRGQVEMLLGNLLGSNVFNALAVVGLAALVTAARGGTFPVAGPALAVVAASTVVTVGVGAALARRPTVGRVTGIGLVALHAASIPALLAIS